MDFLRGNDCLDCYKMGSDVTYERISSSIRLAIKNRWLILLRSHRVVYLYV